MFFIKDYMQQSLWFSEVKHTIAEKALEYLQEFFYHEPFIHELLFSEQKQTEFIRLIESIIITNEKASDLPSDSNIQSTYIPLCSLLLAILQFVITSGEKMSKKDFSLFCAYIIFAIIKTYNPCLQVNNKNCIIIIQALISYEKKPFDKIEKRIFFKEIMSLISACEANTILLSLEEINLIKINKNYIFLNKNIS